MSDQFEKLIRDSAPEIPDPGEYRRLNRVALRERLHQMETPTRNRPLVLVTSCLVLMMLVSGQLNQLGSDGAEYEILQGIDGLGSEITLVKDKFTGSTMNALGSEEETQELLQQKAAGEGIFENVACLTYRGKSDWTFTYLHFVNGEWKASNTIYNPSGYPDVDLPDYLHFVQTYYRDLLDWTRFSPPIRIYTEEIEGTTILMRTWQKSYPGYGMVTFTRGIPQS